MRHLLAAAVVLGVAALAYGGDPPRRNVWRVAADVEEALVLRDVGEWARTLEAQPLPSDAYGLLERYEVLVRAGHLRRLDPLFEALGTLPRDVQRNGVRIEAIPPEADGAWDRVRRLCEGVPWIDPQPLRGLLFGPPERRPTEPLEAWLRAREAVNPEWFGVLCAYVRERGGGAALVEETAQEVRKHPESVEPVRRYLEARNALVPDQDASWLVDVSKPALAWECFLLSRGAPSRLRIALLRRALALPFTRADAEAGNNSAWGWGGGERGFRARVKVGLIEAHLDAGDVKEAQVVLEETAAEYPEGIPNELAGRVQAASGARVIEGRIRKEEPERGDTVRYWFDRARYFVGRKEAAEAEAAFVKALDLAPRGNVAAKEGPLRWGVVSDYARWLRDLARRDDAAALLHREIAEADPAGLDASQAVGCLLDLGLGTTVRADDEAMWRFLAARERWEPGAASDAGLLVALFRDEKTRSGAWDRALALAAGAHPSRNAALAGAAEWMGDLARAILLLEDAHRRLADPGERQRLAPGLYSLYCRSGDWRKAEALMPFPNEEHIAWQYANLAAAAARAGAPKDAARLWGRYVNFHRGRTEVIDALVQAGARDALIALYESLGKADPECEYVPRILATLRKGAAAGKESGK